MGTEKKQYRCLSCDKPIEEGNNFRLCIDCQVLLRFALQKEKSYVEMSLNGFGKKTRDMMLEMIRNAKASIHGKAIDDRKPIGDDNGKESVQDM